MNTFSLAAIIAVGFLAPFSFAETAKPDGGERNPRESDYVREWCAARGGDDEYRLADGTRADCLLRDFVAEFDFGDKWAECVGQAQHYAQILARATQPRRPVCILIRREKTSAAQFARYSARAHSAAHAAGVVVRCINHRAAPFVCPLFGDIRDGESPN